MTTISWSSFVLVALVWVLVISKVPRRTPVAPQMLSCFRLTRTWLSFDFSTVSGFNLDGSTQQDAFIASWLQVTLLRAWASTSKRKSREVEGEFHQVCEFVWACLETATKAEGAAGETGRRRSRPRQSQFGIVRKMQYFLHVWDFVLVDFFGSSMTHGFYCVLSTVWGGADAESCTPGCRATRALPTTRVWRYHLQENDYRNACSAKNSFAGHFLPQKPTHRRQH